MYVQPYQKRDPAHIFSCKLPENLENFSEQLFFSERLLTTVSAHHGFVFIYDWRKGNVIYIRHGQARKCYRIAPELRPKFVQSNSKAPTIQFICLEQAIVE